MKCSRGTSLEQIKHGQQHLTLNNNDPTRDSFDRYYMPQVEIKDLNLSIDNKPFFDQPVKYKQGAYGKLIEMSRNETIQQKIY